MGKVLQKNDLISALADVRRGRKVVFTNGCFDLLHVGHIRYLAEAKAQGDILVVAVNTDESVRRLKGLERPIQQETDRAEIVAALSSVDFVTYFSEDTPIELIKAVKPEILVKGGDWTVDKIVGADFVQSYGGIVRSLQFLHGRSTSAIVEKLKG